MRFATLPRALPFLAASLAWTMVLPEANAQGPKDAPNNPAAIRKALDQKITLDYSGTSLEDAIEHLRQKTKLTIGFDTFVLQQMGIGVGVPGFPGGGGFQGNVGAPMPGQPGMPVPGQFLLKIDNGKVRTALQSVLNSYNLTFVILGDGVLITTEEIGQMRLLRQRVSVNIKGQPLVDALTKLAEDTGVNLLIDPRQTEKAKAKITVQLEDVTLDTAMRLLTELAELGSVSMGNVVFVTSDVRADKLRKENSSQTNPGFNPFLNFPGGLPPVHFGRVGAAFGGVAAPGVVVNEQPAVAVPVPPPPPPKK